MMLPIGMAASGNSTPVRSSVAASVPSGGVMICTTDGLPNTVAPNPSQGNTSEPRSDTVAVIRIAAAPASRTPYVSSSTSAAAPVVIAVFFMRPSQLSDDAEDSLTYAGRRQDDALMS